MYQNIWHNIKITLKFINFIIIQLKNFSEIFFKTIWRPPSQSELTPKIFDMGLTHLGSEAFNILPNMAKQIIMILNWMSPSLSELTQKQYQHL